MNIIKEKLLLCMEQNSETGALEYFLIANRHRYFLNDDLQIIVGEQEVFFDMPTLTDTEMRLKAVEQMRKRQKNIRAEAQRKVAELDEKIQKLLLLEHKADDQGSLHPVPEGAVGAGGPPVWPADDGPPF